MRLCFLVVALNFVPGVAAQTDLDADLATADSFATALMRFPLDLMGAGSSAPSPVDLTTFDFWDVVEESLGDVMTQVESALRWAQAIPLMECDADKRVALTQLGREAERVRSRTVALAGAFAALALEAEGTSAEAMITESRATVNALGVSSGRAMSLQAH